METGEFVIEQIEKNFDCNDFNEACQTVAVKSEPCEIYNFNECVRHDESSTGKTDFADHKNAIDGYLEQNEEILDEKNPRPEDLHSFETSKCDTTQFKNEDDIDSCYEDIKCETDSGLLQLEVKNELVIGDEVTEERDASAVLWRLSMPLVAHDNEMVDTEKKIICKSCGKFFSCEKELKIHEMIHAREKPFHCIICSKAHSNSGDLCAHEKIHNREKPFQCVICSKSFSHKGNLTVHTRFHTGEKPFQCELCAKAYSSSSDLKVHESIHTGEKPYHCRICSKSFSQTYRLKVHEKIHTGEKPHQCKTCSKAFFNSSGLKIHERVHTGEKPFECKICSKSFSRMCQLKIHERVHSGGKPFQCQICFRGFSNSKNLGVHGKRIHGQLQ